MPKGTRSAKKVIESYDHKGAARANNPPVGLVTPETDRDGKRRRYEYDPHLDPQLVWAGKAEHTSFEVETVSLHVHERIDPRTIIEAVRKRNGDGGPQQLSLFEEPEENLPLREAIEFYRHAHNWSNRLIAGDSLQVMNSLLEKEGMAGKVKMAYFDPPYGVKYGSNFQPFVYKRDVTDGKDADLNQEPEMIRAFRDTWELGIHSYLTYLRDRLLLTRELLDEGGSCFVQISDENLHHVREVLDEVFGNNNFVSLITFKTPSGFETSTISTVGDFLLWYAKDKARLTVCKLYEDQPIVPGYGNATWVLLPDGSYRGVSAAEKRGEKHLPEGARLYKPDNIQSQGAASEPQPFEYEGKVYKSGTNSHWKASFPEGMERLALAGRIHVAKDSIQYRRFATDFPFTARGNVWTDTQTGSFTEKKIYAVQTNTKVIERCVLLATMPGDLVLDVTCGGGTTAVVCEQWGRRWITCDTSRIAVTLAKKRLMTGLFDYYELAHPDEGVGSGFVYRTVPHITLKSIANNPEITVGMEQEEIDVAIRKYVEQKDLYDQPKVDKSKARVSGPFTVEAVPAPAVRPLSEVEGDRPGDESVSRSGETLRQDEWRDELLKCGIRGKGGQRIHFTRVEPLAGTRWLHAEAETKEDRPQRVVISLGPEHAPLEQRQVEQALEEAGLLKPAPKMVVFATFQFDPEAAKDIDETQWPGMTLLKVQMNTDLLTEDLKKKRASNESFWMIGQPDVEVRQFKKGEHKGEWQVEVRGFDYYNPKNGTVESGDTSKIALWMLDTDYDGRSLYPRQVFFPMAGAKEGWARLAKNLKAEIDEERIEQYRGTVSLPFAPGRYRRVAVKIVDDRGIESLKIVEVG